MVKRVTAAPTLSAIEILDPRPVIPSKAARRVELTDRPREKELTPRQRARQRYRERYPDRVEKSWREWYAKPENAASAKARAAKWKKENLDRERVKQRLYMRRKRAAAKAQREGGSA